MPRGYLLLVLHAHLPYVRHPEYDRFLEERWFFEAVVETYIPLIKFFDRLRAEGTPFKVTLSVSPTLANMMEDPLLRDRCLRHLDLSLGLAEPRPLFGVAAPVFTPSGVAAFGRHPTTSKLVWSSIIGYPADFNYREYYRDIGFDLDPDYLAPFQYAQGVRTHTGIKYHRITGPRQDK